MSTDQQTAVCPAQLLMARWYPEGMEWNNRNTKTICAILNLSTLLGRNGASEAREEGTAETVLAY